MFDLESHLKHWRAELLTTENITAAEVDELESHLRDSIDELKDSPSLTADESFWLATRRVGSPESIALEFAKVNGARTWTRRAQWMLAGYLFLSLTISVVMSLSHVLTLAAFYLKFPLWAAFSLSSVGVTLTVALLIWWTWSLTKGKSEGMQRFASQFANVARSGRIAPMFFAVFGLLGLKYGFQMVSTISASRFMDPQQFGMASLVGASTGWMNSILLLGTIITLLCWLVRTDTQSGAGWNSRKVLFATALIAILTVCAYGLMSFGVGPLYGGQWASYLK